MPAVELRNVSFGYPPAGLDDLILDDVSLKIEPLDFLAIIGPNGGGKTTLLKVILGLLRPQRGSVRVLDRPPAQTRHRIGYVPQHARIDPSIPAHVLDVVLTGRLAHSRWGFRYPADHVAKARAALEQTDTADLAARPIGQLSGGQRQRVLIARALACDAALLLLDEPTAAVDPHAEAGLTDLLHELNQRLPIVIVSHDVSHVSAHMKRIACLNRRLTVHDADAITHEAMHEIYHGHVKIVHHDHECPVTEHDHARSTHKR
jgi:zinc transport system ATP-binding protein